jgi:hypothetical protein
LGQDDKFGWTEPEGHVYEIALRNLDRLKDEIYRVCYLMSQAGGGCRRTTAMTGYSKERDYAITQEVLRGFGDSVKDTMKRVLKAIVAAREDAIGVDVAGLDEFDIGDFAEELATRRGCWDGDRVGDAEEAGVQEAGDEVFVRCAAGDEGSDRAGDRRAVGDDAGGSTLKSSAVGECRPSPGDWVLGQRGLPPFFLERSGMEQENTEFAAGDARA